MVPSALHAAVHVRRRLPQVLAFQGLPEQLPGDDVGSLATLLAELCQAEELLLRDDIDAFSLRKFPTSKRRTGRREPTTHSWKNLLTCVSACRTTLETSQVAVDQPLMVEQEGPHASSEPSATS